MLYKSLFQLYPDNFQNNYFLLSDKLEDIRYCCNWSLFQQKHRLCHLPHTHTYSISVITKGKYCLLKSGALPKLVALLTDPCSEARLNSIKALTLLAETPVGKAQLQSSRQQVIFTSMLELTYSRYVNSFSTCIYLFSLYYTVSL